MFRNLRTGLNEAQSIRQAHAALNNIVLPATSLPLIEQEVDQYFKALDKTNNQEMYRSFRDALGVDIRQELAIVDTTATLNQFRRENIDLIRTIPSTLHQDLYERMTTTFAEKPFSRAAMGKLVREQYGASGYNARRLARDQTSKATGQFNKVRQTGVGIEQYKWRTSQDNRVRPSHAAHEGKLFDWENPPAGTGHPGTDVQCRCSGQPEVPEALVAKWPKAKPKPKPKVDPNAAKIADLREGLRGSLAELNHNILLYKEGRLTYSELTRRFRLAATNIGRHQKDLIALVPKEPRPSLPSLPARRKPKLTPKPIPKPTPKPTPKPKKPTTTEIDPRPETGVEARRQILDDPTVKHLTAQQEALVKDEKKWRLVKETAASDFLSAGANTAQRNRALGQTGLAHKELDQVLRLQGAIEQRSQKLTDRIRTTFLEHKGSADPINSTLKNATAANQAKVDDGVAAFQRLVPSWGGGKKNVTFEFSKTGRAYHQNYGPSGSSIVLKQDEAIKTIVHELGHGFEARLAENLKQAASHLQQRTKGEKLRTLEGLGKTGYGSEERTRPDKFFNAYVGKNYSRRLDKKSADSFNNQGYGYVPSRLKGTYITATEVTSIGMEAMYVNPIALARQDPKLFDFIFDKVMKKARVDDA